MKELEKQFVGEGEVKDFLFRQIESSDAYIYEVTAFDKKHYEVFLRQENTRFNNVSYPRTNNFGVWAWAVMSLDKAYEKYRSLLSIQAKRKTLE